MPNQTETQTATGICEMPWLACPTHGATLRASGGRVWCRAYGCLWEREAASFDQPCDQPATHLVTDQEGCSERVCDGHARAARELLIGGRVDPL